MLVVSALVVFHALIVVTPSLAQGGCEFQSPMVDGRSVMDAIVAGGDLDKEFAGLHQVDPSHWPGVDTQGNIRPIFRNGGLVVFSGLDSAVGGFGIILDGVGVCTGWRMAVWHMPDDPSSRLPVGTTVDGNTILGRHGHSGNLDNDVWDHNHVSVGFASESNPFDFGDSTIVRQIGGYWWIHPARLSSGGLNTPEWTAMGELTAWVPCLTALGVVLALYVWIGPLKFRGAKSLGKAGSWALSKLVWALIFGPRLAIRQAQRFGFLWGMIISLGWSVFLFVAGVRGVINLPEFTKPIVAWVVPGDCAVSASYSVNVLRWCDQIMRYSQERGLDPNLVAAVITQESGGDPQAYSTSGAVGLMQVMPRDGIAASFQCTNGPCFADRPTSEELRNPEFNIAVGTQLLAGNVERLDSVRDGLKAYGPSDRGYEYADKVLSIYEVNK